ncbi:MAG: HEPN domain-containing protein [Bacteroidota bacterium]
MNKADHIEYWKISAGKSLLATGVMFAGGSYVESLFWMHLTIEKMLKAHWVMDNVSNIPPKIHDLRKLEIKTNLNLTLTQLAFLDKMNLFQLEGRYPDFNFAAYQLYDESATKLVLDEAENLYQCLLNKLP